MFLNSSSATVSRACTPVYHATKHALVKMHTCHTIYKQNIVFIHSKSSSGNVYHIVCNFTKHKKSDSVVRNRGKMKRTLQCCLVSVESQQKQCENAKRIQNQAKIHVKTLVLCCLNVNIYLLSLQLFKICQYCIFSVIWTDLSY